MTLKAILFDFDDTLGDREKYAYALYREIVEKAVPNKSELEKEELVQHCMVLDQHGDTNKYFIYEKIKEFHGVDLGEDINTVWEENLWRYAVTFPHVKEILETLKNSGYLLGIITNGDAVGQRKKIQTAGIESYFDTIVISGEIGIKKPDVRIFQIAAKQLNVKEEECLMVGDLFYRDVMGALNAGMDAVWIWPHGNREIHTNVKKISHIKEIIQLVNIH